MKYSIQRPAKIKIGEFLHFLAETSGKVKSSDSPAAKASEKRQKEDEYLDRVATNMRRR